jgi:hypothetical protein
MLAPFLFAASGVEIPAPPPSLDSFSVTFDGGACEVVDPVKETVRTVPATTTVSWDVTEGAAGYELRLYKENTSGVMALQTVYPASSDILVVTHSGAVDGSSGGSAVRHNAYRMDVVKSGTGEVITSLSDSEPDHHVGTCLFADAGGPE